MFVKQTILGLTFAMALGSAARADEFKAAIGRENNNRCHMDVCYPFTLTSSTLISVNPDGAFYKITYLMQEDEYRSREDGNDYDYPRRGKDERGTFVVFCSKTRPQLDGEALCPGDEEGVFGATELIHLEYWAACHNYIAKDGASSKLVKKLGYHLAPASND